MVDCIIQIMITCMYSIAAALSYLALHFTRILGLCSNPVNIFWRSDCRLLAVLITVVMKSLGYDTV
jgi:DUF1365 family protein